MSEGWENKLEELQARCASIHIVWDAGRVYWTIWGTLSNGRVWSVSNTSIPWAVCDAHRMVKEHLIKEVHP